MQPDERDLAFLWDMRNAARAIARFIEGLGAENLQQDLLVRSAVHWQVIVLGEAARRVSREFREATPEIDWLLLIRQRNFYAHEYDEADPIDLWAFVAAELPQIAQAVDRFLTAPP